jgi:hypothetical protein
MTRVFSVDGNNDLYIGGDGLLAISNGLEAVLQGCEHAVKAQLMEMMFAYDSGVATMATAWSGSPNIFAFEAEVRRAISSVDGVIGIESLEASIRSNVMIYSATIVTTFGTGKISNGI